MRSLVLIGHGSHHSGESAQALCRHAERLRGAGVFDEVIEGYWQEEPSLRQVLKTAGSTDVTVVPVFIAAGYFTETVIPRELGLGHQGPVPPGGIARTLGGRTVRYTPPYGVHPAMAEVVLARVREVCPEPAAHDTALVVLGHGAGHHEPGARAVYEQAERLRHAGLFGEVHALFLDEVSGPDWRAAVRAPRVVVVPFSGGGRLSGETIPAPLGLSGEVTAFADGPGGPQTVYYARPVGTHPRVADVILQLAQEASPQAGATGPRDGDVERAHEAAWAALHARAREGLRLGELLIRPTSGVYELRHALDEGQPGNELLTLVTAEGLRDHTRRDQAGRHRPVHTLRTLPRGWRAVLAEADLRAGLHAVYPAVVEETYAHSVHALRATPWATTARRQTGAQARVQRATPEQVERVAQEVCGACLRTRLWSGQRLGQTFFSGVPGAIPCAEACPYLVAEVRDELAGRRARAQAPRPRPADA